MKKTISLFLLALFALPCLAAAESEGRLHFKGNGFSIAPLEEETEIASYLAVQMFLPSSEAFAPSVNVIIQRYKGTIKEYAELSRQQFEAAEFTIMSEKIAPTFVVWEYSGMIKDHQFHWYAKAERKEGKVYLVTAAATESQWKTLSVKLKACVDSFKIEKGEEVAPADADK